MRTRTCLLQTRFLRRQAIRTYNLVVPRGAGSDKVRLHGLQAGALTRLAPKDLPQTPRSCHAFPGTRGTEVHGKRIAVVDLDLEPTIQGMALPRCRSVTA